MIFPDSANTLPHIFIMVRGWKAAVKLLFEPPVSKEKQRVRETTTESGQKIVCQRAGRETAAKGKN